MSRKHTLPDYPCVCLGCGTEIPGGCPGGEICRRCEKRDVADLIRETGADVRFTIEPDGSIRY